MLKQAEQVDTEQDAALGSRRGDELPEELKRREERLAKIREAKARLEAEARAKAEEEQHRRDEEQAKEPFQNNFSKEHRLTILPLWQIRQ